MFICVTFKSYMEWRNTQCVSIRTTTILTTTVSTYHDLNYFSHMIYMLTSMYQNIAKPLTYPNNEYYLNPTVLTKYWFHIIFRTNFILHIFIFIYQKRFSFCAWIAVQTIFYSNTIDCLVGWLFGFYGISTFVGYLMPNTFLYKWTVLFQPKYTV